MQTYTHVVVLSDDKIIGFSTVAASEYSDRNHVALDKAITPFIDDHLHYQYKNGEVVYSPNSDINDSLDIYSYAAVETGVETGDSLISGLVRRSDSAEFFDTPVTIVPLTTTINTNYDDITNFVYVDGVVKYDVEAARLALQAKLAQEDQAI
jgi:hypothetical protein